ncbi:hypothetical protein [Kitasatospora sp. NPDC088134]|uniref:hypothetical protein n=1 Tax=Kitasatospora sp. NPDC088134 TaxID=3364071 RepID=UPI00382CBB1C
MPTSTGPTHPPGRTLAAAAGRRWRRLTAPGGFLTRRHDDLVHVLEHGLRAGAGWVRVLGALLAAAAAAGAGTVLYDLAQRLLAAAGTNPHLAALIATVTRPMHHYLDQHTQGLPITAADAYLLWQATGAAAALLAFASTTAAARLAWTAWAAATLTVVWQASPEGGRTVATAVAAAGLALASLPALRGLRLPLGPRIMLHLAVTPAPCAARPPIAHTHRWPGQG